MNEGEEFDYNKSPESSLWSAVLALYIDDVQRAFKNRTVSTLKSLQNCAQSENFAWICDSCGVHVDRVKKYVNEKIVTIERGPLHE